MLICFSTLDGNEIWMAAEAAYTERVGRVENQIISCLREQLTAAKTAAAMFRVFGRFNALFVRPKIRSAIQEWQQQLIDSVKEDIRKLHDKFKAGYRVSNLSCHLRSGALIIGMLQHSQVAVLSRQRDMPPAAGQILWAKQIERKLASNMKRVEDVLGKGWELYSEGSKLQTESNSFKRKLDTRPLFEAWRDETARKELKVIGNMLSVQYTRSKGGQYNLIVNYDPDLNSSVPSASFQLLWVLTERLRQIFPASSRKLATCWPLATICLTTWPTCRKMLGVSIPMR